MKQLGLKKSLRYLGHLLSFLGLLFVIQKLVHYRNLLDFDTLSPTIFLLLIVMTVLYGFSGLLLALGWQKLLNHLRSTVPILWAVKTYGISQLAKYIPGNIFHFINRQLMGAQSQISTLTLTKSMFWELKLISLTAVTFSLLIIPLVYPIISQNFVLVIFVISLIAGILNVHFKINSQLSCTIIAYTLFHIISGTIFTLILILITPNTNDLTLIFPSLLGAYVIAWLAGLLIPGAPAGVGIREVVLFAVLKSHVTQVNLLTAIMLTRAVTVGGDIIFYLLAASSYFFARKLITIQPVDTNVHVWQNFDEKLK